MSYFHSYLNLEITQSPAVTIWQNLWLTGIQNMHQTTSKIKLSLLWSIIYPFPKFHENPCIIFSVIKTGKEEKKKRREKRGSKHYRRRHLVEIITVTTRKRRQSYRHAVPCWQRPQVAQKYAAELLSMVTSNRATVIVLVTAWPWPLTSGLMHAKRLL